MDLESLGGGVAVNQKPETATTSSLSVLAAAPLRDVRGVRELANLDAVFSNEQNKTERRHLSQSWHYCWGARASDTRLLADIDPCDPRYRSAGVPLYRGCSSRLR